MKIGIFDFNHYEMVYSLSLVFHSDDNEITFFVNRSLQEKLIFSLKGKVAAHYITKEGNETIEYFLKQCEKYIQEKRIDLLIMNSIDNHYSSFYPFLKRISCAKILGIHNVNSWFNPFFTFSPKFKYLAVKENSKPLNFLSVIFHPQLLLNFYFKKAICKNVNAIIVLEDTLKKNILDNHLTNLPIFVFPYSIYEKEVLDSFQKEQREECGKRIKIVIPGSIEEKRRDYILFFEVIEKLFEKKDDFTIALLGKPSGVYGENILSYIKILKEKGYNIEHYYNENNYFESIKRMAVCDIILSPINVITNFENTKEIYGETKATGVLFDMMRYAKPGIIPKGINSSVIMESSIVQYNDKEDLYDILNKIIQEIDYREDLKENAIKNAEIYSISVIRMKVLPEINQVLNSAT